ncbi:hypothetical protein DFS34DRAFT_652929 [Phlyctochytrium arcticum]|nr:hypothetical protein DFS34DRAFT_652929 [Phlyctochytrium arcticum]
MQIHQHNSTTTTTTTVADTASMASVPAEILLLIPKYLSLSDTLAFASSCRRNAAFLLPSNPLTTSTITSSTAASTTTIVTSAATVTRISAVNYWELAKSHAYYRTAHNMSLLNTFGPPSFFAYLVLHLHRFGAPRIGLVRTPETANGDSDATSFGWKALRYLATVAPASTSSSDTTTVPSIDSPKRTLAAAAALLREGAFVDHRDWSLPSEVFPNGFADWPVNTDGFWKSLPAGTFVTYWGSTPLSEAATRGNEKLVKLLLDAGANPNLLFNHRMENQSRVTAEKRALWAPFAHRKQSTAFDEALLRGHLDVCRALVGAGFAASAHADRLCVEFAATDNAPVLQTLINDFGFAPFLTLRSASAIAKSGARQCWLLLRNLVADDFRTLVAAEWVAKPVSVQAVASSTAGNPRFIPRSESLASVASDVSATEENVITVAQISAMAGPPVTPAMLLAAAERIGR